MILHWIRLAIEWLELMGLGATVCFVQGIYSYKLVSMQGNAKNRDSFRYLYQYIVVSNPMRLA